MTNNIIYVDREGYTQFHNDIHEAEQKLRQVQLAKSTATTRFELFQLELEEELALKKVQRLKERLSDLRIIDGGEIASTDGGVTIGDFVTVKINIDGQEETLSVYIVASVSRGYKSVSINSPLGAALLGKHVEEPFTYAVGENKISATVLEIER